MMEFSLIIPAFIAGLFTFLAPCTLPLVPAYLSFISGVSEGELADPKKAKIARRKVFINGLFYVVGFSLVFIVFGTLIGFLGQALVPFRIWLARIGGIFVIFFGLFMLGVFNIQLLSREYHPRVPFFFERGRPLNSFLLGATFAFGWTPCVGPVLGSVLLLASASATAFWGAFLLFLFSLGLAIPFLAVAYAWGGASAWISRFSRYGKVISVIGGLFLVGVGILLLTDQFSLMIQWGYRLFRFINYQAIYKFL